MNSSITINSNTASLTAQRRLGESTSKLEQSFTRLSSGLRINKASDDPAGLAISEALNVDARVFNQGIRNLNDSISLLSIAEGALDELSNIIIRQSELAEQAANGTLGLEQRRALNDEANALVDEYNRIVQSTDFNNQSLLNLPLSSFRSQSGYGTDGGIDFSIGTELARVVGTGNFEDADAYSTGSGSYMEPIYSTTADFNGDGLDDIATANYGDFGDGDTISVILANDDGTFNAGISFWVGNNVAPTSINVGDFNGDGNVDIAATSLVGSKINIFLGNGDGSFEANVAYTSPPYPCNIEVADFNSDGFDDIIATNEHADKVSIFWGNGDGTFEAAVSVAVGDTPSAIDVGDINGDNILDLVVSNRGDSTVSILIGNNDGSFKAADSLSLGSTTPYDVALADTNNDGVLDILALRSTIDVLLGNGDGSFQAKTSFATATSSVSFCIADFDGDGVIDIATASDSTDTANIHIGNGDGTFSANLSYAISNYAQSLSVGDFNGDGVADLVTTNYFEGINVLLAETTQTTTLAQVNIALKENVLTELDNTRDNLARIDQELGAIGAVQSRLSTAVNNLKQTKENTITAKSRIKDADIATEAAGLVRNQILQQAGASILAQANQTPAFALKFLGV